MAKQRVKHSQVSIGYDDGMSKLSRRSLAAVTFLLCLAAAIYLVRTPLRNAAKIKVGDSETVVRSLLGEPDDVFETTEEFRSSYRSYEFKDVSGRPVEELPPVDRRAEWFEFGSAGHLIYYDENGVTDVFWGGT